MLLIGLSQTYRFYVSQYVVFMIKLILSYLPVCLTHSLLSSPLKHIAVVELMGLVSVSWVCPEGLPAIRDRQQAFYTYGRVKMSYMECRG